MDIREINKYSLQEIYDYIVDHLRKQGKKAIVDGVCQYRTEDGLSCAVGCLIPDDMYDKKFEENGIKTLVIDFKEFYFISGNIINFLYDVQGVHDIVTSKDWEKSFKRLAKDYNLQYNVPE